VTFDLFLKTNDNKNISQIHTVYCNRSIALCAMQKTVYYFLDRPVPEIIDPVFAKTSRKRSFSMTENERFGLVLRLLGL
jgi:hypothetical protein